MAYLDLSQLSVTYHYCNNLLGEMETLYGYFGDYPDFVMTDDWTIGGISTPWYFEYQRHMQNITDALHEIGVKHIPNCGIQFGVHSVALIEDVIYNCDGIIIEWPLDHLATASDVEDCWECCDYAAGDGKPVILLGQYHDGETGYSNPTAAEFIAAFAMTCNGPVVSTSNDDSPVWDTWPTMYGPCLDKTISINEDGHVLAIGFFEYNELIVDLTAHTYQWY